MKLNNYYYIFSLIVISQLFTSCASTPVGQGTITSPYEIALTAGATTGSVGTTSSYYKITGVTAGITYTVTITNIDAGEDVDLFVYDDSSFLDQLCSSSNGYDSPNDPEGCNAVPSGSNLYVEVYNSSNSDGAFFDIDAN